MQTSFALEFLWKKSFCSPKILKPPKNARVCTYWNRFFGPWTLRTYLDPAHLLEPHFFSFGAFGAVCFSLCLLHFSFGAFGAECIFTPCDSYWNIGFRPWTLRTYLDPAHPMGPAHLFGEGGLPEVPVVYQIEVPLYQAVCDDPETTKFRT